ncbi:hypothetical protein BH23GEM11_BH23GEM11_20630 [soil metagenome]
MRRFGAHLIPAVASAVLVGATMLISSRKYFWNDELYSFVLIADPSFSGMLSAFHDAINNTPALYFILGWGWAQVFGAGELSLRLFSCLGILAALWTMWILLRRVYGTWPAALSVVMVFCTSGLILEQMAEARMYGLLLALAASAVYLFDAAMRSNRRSPLLIGATVATHAALIHTHLFGPLYSATMALGAVIMLGRPGRRSHPMGARDHLLGIVASWPLFLLYIPSYLNQSAAYGSRGWLTVPTLGDLVSFLALDGNELLGSQALVLLFLGLGLHLLLRSRHGQIAAINQDTSTAPASEVAVRPRDRHLLWVAWLLLAFPVGIYLFSVLIRPIFWYRYMIPSVLGWCILIASVTSRFSLGDAWRAGPGRRWQAPAARAICIAMLLPLLAFPILTAHMTVPRERPGLSDTTFGFESLPVVSQVLGFFLERHHYAPDRGRYFYVLDAEGAADPASGGFGYQEFVHAEAFRRQYPERLGEHIMTQEMTEDFLARHERFVVLAYPDYVATCPARARGLSRQWSDLHCPQWVRRRLVESPGFSVQLLGHAKGLAVLLVERVSTRGA